MSTPPPALLRYSLRVARGPLLELFDASLVGRAAEPALDVGSPGGPVRTLTFREVEQRSRRMAQVLAGRGLRAGDRLAVQLPNGLPFLDLFLACLKLGAIFVPVNVLYREREMGHIVADAEPFAVVTTPDLAGLVPRGTPVLEVDELALSSRGASVGPAPRDPPKEQIPRDPRQNGGPSGAKGADGRGGRPPPHVSGHTIIARITEGNESSLHLHRSVGFTHIGIMKEVGKKFGKRQDVHLMQKIYK